MADSWRLGLKKLWLCAYWESEKNGVYASPGLLEYCPELVSGRPAFWDGKGGP